jgi:hypothetical protein
MAGARSKAIIPVVVILTLAALGGGGWFGYRYLLDTRAGLAIQTAADFELAGRDGDADEWAGFLPPGFADELKDDELEAGIGYFGTSWEHDDREADDGVITDTYLNTDRDTFEDYDLIAEWELDGDASLTRATVIAAVEWGPPEGERGEAEIIIDLVWLDGAWRVARYECTDGSDAEFTFWDGDEDAEDLAEEYLEYLADKGYRLDGEGAPALTEEQPEAGTAPELTEEELEQGQLPEGHPDLAAPALTEEELESGELPAPHPPITGTVDD